MKVKEIRKVILQYIEDLGYEVVVNPISKTYYAWLNGDEEDNPNYYMVTNFYIKECRGWLFGLWIQPQTLNGTIKYTINFFSDYKGAINKFKPSATFLCENTTLTEHEVLALEVSKQMFWYYIENLISMIKNQPYLAYYMSVHFLKYPDYEGNYFLYFIWDRILDNTWEIRRPFCNLMWKFKWQMVERKKKK